jgi:predicted nucleic acid-binding protein
MTKPLFLLDSSPLITLALFPIHKPAIETLLSVVDLAVVETVAIESTAYPTHRDAVVIKSLLDAGRISRHPVPTTTIDALIDGYSKVDSGERDTIRLALTMPDARLVLDDVAAFIMATHFDLSPIMLLDLLAKLAKTGELEKETALKIVTAVASRYSEAFVNHTKHKLGELDS